MTLLKKSTVAGLVVVGVGLALAPLIISKIASGGDGGDGGNGVSTMKAEIVANSFGDAIRVPGEQVHATITVTNIGDKTINGAIGFTIWKSNPDGSLEWKVDAPYKLTGNLAPGASGTYDSTSALIPVTSTEGLVGATVAYKHKTGEPAPGDYIQLDCKDSQYDVTRNPPPGH